MSTSVGVETFTDTNASGWMVLIQSTCLRWSSTEYTEWKGNGENRLTHGMLSRILATDGEERRSRI